MRGAGGKPRHTAHRKVVSGAEVSFGAAPNVVTSGDYRFFAGPAATRSSRARKPLPVTPRYVPIFPVQLFDEISTRTACRSKPAVDIALATRRTRTLASASLSAKQNANILSVATAATSPASTGRARAGNPI